MVCLRFLWRREVCIAAVIILLFDEAKQRAEARAEEGKGPPSVAPPAFLTIAKLTSSECVYR
jgi:formate hydrogenlyase subunit 4